MPVEHFYVLGADATKHDSTCSPDEAEGRRLQALSRDVPAEVCLPHSFLREQRLCIQSVTRK